MQKKKDQNKGRNKRKRRKRKKKENENIYDFETKMNSLMNKLDIQIKNVKKYATFNHGLKFANIDLKDDKNINNNINDENTHIKKKEQLY